MLIIVPRSPNVIAIAVSEEPSKHVSKSLDIVTSGN
jgi:hypothetical protein